MILSYTLLAVGSFTADWPIVFKFSHPSKIGVASIYFKMVEK